MLQKLKNTLLTLVGTALLLTPVLAISPAFADSSADTTGQFCNGINATGSSQAVGTPGTQQCSNDGGTTNNNAITNILKAVVNILSIVVGIVAVIMIIVGGFKYITSGGSESNVSGAKNTILYAIIGLIIVALAQIIVRFVINRALGGVSNQGPSGA